MSNKQKYREFCKIEKNIPIFSIDWWLDSVCGEENWDVAIVEKGGEIWATMPYYIKKKWGFTLITMPPLTQKLGPYIKYPQGQKYYKKLSWEKEIMNELIDQLPEFDYFYQQWDYIITNWLPFYWRGFKQTTRYTYVININDNNENNIIENFSHAKRKQIKKAIRNGINIKSNIIQPEDFYNLHKRELEFEKAKISYSFKLFNRLYKNALSNDQGVIISAEDLNGIIHGALFIIFNKQSAYDLISAFNPDFLDSGASSLLVLEAIKYTQWHNIDRFDFEGSMIENVENSFRQFGAIQSSYSAVYKINSKLLKIRECLKELLR